MAHKVLHYCFIYFIYFLNLLSISGWHRQVSRSFQEHTYHQECDLRTHDMTTLRPVQVQQDCCIIHLHNIFLASSSIDWPLIHLVRINSMLWYSPHHLNISSFGFEAVRSILRLTQTSNYMWDREKVLFLNTIWCRENLYVSNEREKTQLNGVTINIFSHPNYKQ